MITYIKINGFKSFMNFEMEFSPFTIIAGLNASGKSNLFDALKLLSKIAETDNFKKAFKEQRGEFIELFTQFGPNDFASEMEFNVEMLVNKNIKDAWGNSESLKYTRLRYEIVFYRKTNTNGIEDIFLKHEKLETIKSMNDKWIKNIKNEDRYHWRPKVTTGKRGQPYINTIIENGVPTIIVPQDGTRGGNRRRFVINNSTRSVLSSFDATDFPHVLAAKEEMRSWRFLEFNPYDLRQPTKKDEGDDKITESGRNLAASLYRIKQEDKYFLTEISRKLQLFIPSFTKVDVLDDVSNNQFIIKLLDKDGKSYSSKVLSEGTLRILALCILAFDPQHNGLLCFEEPENGIHPFRLNDMRQLLFELSTDFSQVNSTLRQVITNTHSPGLVDLFYQLDENKNVRLYYSTIKSRIFTTSSGKRKINATSLVPVSSSPQTVLDIPEPDIKLGIETVKKYLSTSNNNQ